MSIETEYDLISLRKIGKIVAGCLQFMGKHLEPGITTQEVDDLGKKFLEQHGARSAPQLVYDFPGATCISVNEQTCHGIPGEKKLQAGDLINIDVSAELNGYFADTGGSFIIPPETKIKRLVCDIAKKALANAMLEATAGANINRIGYAVENEARKHGLTVIENIGSHGVGRSLHEEPGFIANYFDPKDKRILKEGQVITIEPFVSSGGRQALETGDGWTLATKKGIFTAQYEHTMVITKSHPIILTLA
jgi:methionyl aminopeptidase